MLPIPRRKKQMKIELTSQGDNLEAGLDPRFGRADNFIVLDTETRETVIVPNTQNLNAPQGAGIQAAATVAAAGVEAVITGHCGPKAFKVLTTANIRVFNTNANTGRDAVALFIAGKLAEAENADVEGHWMA